MAPTVEDVVIDTSVLLSYVMRDAGADQPAVDVLFERIVEGDVGFLLLDLSVYEILNVLTRRHRQSSSTVARVLDDLTGLADEVVRVSVPLAVAAADIAERTGLSGYDAAFLAAARLTATDVTSRDAQMVDAGARHVGALGL